MLGSLGRPSRLMPNLVPRCNHRPQQFVLFFFRFGGPCRITTTTDVGGLVFSSGHVGLVGSRSSCSTTSRHRQCSCSHRLLATAGLPAAVCRLVAGIRRHGDPHDRGGQSRLFRVPQIAGRRWLLRCCGRGGRLGRIRPPLRRPLQIIRPHGRPWRRHSVALWWQRQQHRRRTRPAQSRRCL